MPVTSLTGAIDPLSSTLAADPSGVAFELATAAAVAAAASVAQAQASQIAAAQLARNAVTGGSPPGGSTASSSAAGSLPPDLAGADTAYRWLVAWAVVILLLIVAARTRLGYTLIYYILALSLLFLVVTNYRWIAAALAPLREKRSLAQ